ncbi:MAG: F0F1 ATP synthase subunit A [Clostridia bacterium]|nr:F0F1 ATP synthase subunit A [Clostridia bacterium]
MQKSFKSKRIVFLAVWLSIIAVIAVAIILLLPPEEKHETIRELMRDGVLHEHNKMSFFGLKVNPAVISAYTVTVILLISAALIRIFAIPRFKTVPGKFQSVIEKLVEFFTDMANKNSHHKPRFVGAYIFSAGVYIFFSTLFELFGMQWITTDGVSVSLPAPISDINAAISLGVLSYAVILGAGIINGGVRGALGVLKDFSLPISMSFRLFGALLSGLLVTELVYYYIGLSFVLPIIVAVMFTLLHAAIQTYVLATLVSIFYGEAVEPKPKKQKTTKEKKEELS